MFKLKIIQFDLQIIIVYLFFIHRIIYPVANLYLCYFIKIVKNMYQIIVILNCDSLISSPLMKTHNSVYYYLIYQVTVL